jgi:hypothetical protein
MTPANDRVYVYALAEPGLPRRFTVMGHRLCSLALGEVDAVIESRRLPDFTTDAIRQQHALVARLAAREPAILPARFGSVADEPALRTLVSSHREEILAALEQVRGCAQMTVRLFFGSTNATRDVAAPAARTGTEFLNRRRQRARQLPAEVERVRRELGPVVRSERVAAGERGGLVTVFHLVPHSAIDDYRERAARLSQILLPLTVTVTGPWPVFAFAPELF